MQITELGQHCIRRIGKEHFVSAGCDMVLSRQPTPAHLLLYPPDAKGGVFATRTQPPRNAHPKTRYFHYFALFLVAVNILDVLSMSNISEYILEVTFILI
jgi:hypothetical protein